MRMDGRSSQHPRPRRCFINIKTFLSYAAVAVVSFHAGCLSSMSSSECPPCHGAKTPPQTPLSSLSSSFRLGNHQQQQQQQQRQRQLQTLALQDSLTSLQNNSNHDDHLITNDNNTSINSSHSAASASSGQERKIEMKNLLSSSSSFPLLPPSVQKLFVGMARVNRDAFAQAFDAGVPLTPTSVGNEEVLVFYSDPSSLPDGVATSLNTKGKKGSTIAAASMMTTTLSPEDATKKCVTMDMIFVDPEETNHCLVIMGQSRSPLVHKWVRVNDKKSDSSSNNNNNNNSNSTAASLNQNQQQQQQPPLQMVGRTHRPDNYFLDYPIKQMVQASYDFLFNYLKHMDQALKKLQPIAQACVQGKKNKVIIAMLCNHGQSELFINFVCSARAKGLDTSQILLFAADVEMKELAEGLGIRVFYDDKVFGTLPQKAAKQFGDETFKQIMLAKVFCLHLINKLGYDILFQDADIVWNKHPLDFFASPSIGNFDMYFHDDGSRSRRTQPYHANGGFFFIRNNKRTTYFLSSLIRKGDFILNQDEQLAMNLLMVDHVSFTGLRVKVFSREDSDFVGGWNYRHQPQAMKKIVKGEVTPYIFHMSWTNHKFEKRQFLEQMGLFFVSDHCVGKTITEIEKETKNITTSCCVAEPVVTCHYRDKPSMIPCRDSPPIDSNAASFW